MVILQVSSSKTLSGGSRQMMLLSQGLVEAGHKVVVCLPPDGDLFEAVKRRGVEVFPVPTGNLNTLWRSSRVLREVARRVQADVAHAHHTQGHNLVLMATIGGGFPPVVVKRGTLVKPKSGSWKYNSGRVQAVAALTGGIRDLLIQIGVRGEKIAVLRHAVELPDPNGFAAEASQVARELELAGAWPVIGTVGNAHQKKGFQYLIDAAPRILATHPQAVFVLVGGGCERFVPQLEEKGIRGSFRLPGFRRDIPAILTGLDIFVFSGAGEDSLPNVVLEAMAMAKPVVASDLEGMREALGEDGRFGRLFAPRDSSDLSRVVLELLQDREAAAALGQAGRQRIVDEYSVRRRVEDALTLYRSMIRIPGREPAP